MLNTSSLVSQTEQHLVVFFFMGLFSLFTSWLAWQAGLFKNSKRPAPLTEVKGADVLKGFLAFVLVQVILVPAIVVIIFHLFYRVDADSITLSDIMNQGSIGLLSILSVFIAVYSVYFSLPADRRKAIWGSSSHWLSDLSLGMATWFVSYPLVTTLSQLISIAVLWIFQQETVDQVAVKHVKEVRDPLILMLTIIGITVIIPCVEELLFRGLLQSWLRSKFKQSVGAIILTSLIFALFHYSTSQGVTNIELLFSLFMLSCFLGLLYERQRSLWAPIGLHGFFNAVSILMILFES